VIAALFLTLLEIYGKEFSKQLTFVHKRPNAETPGAASTMNRG